MKAMSPHVVAAVLNALNASDEESRTEILRVRMQPAQKEAFMKYSNAIGLPAATNAYNVLMAKMQAHVSQRPAGRTGATRRPVARGAMAPRRL
jgi:hypothetical protein